MFSTFIPDDIQAKIDADFVKVYDKEVDYNAMNMQKYVDVRGKVHCGIDRLIRYYFNGKEVPSRERRWADEEPYRALMFH